MRFTPIQPRAAVTLRILIAAMIFAVSTFAFAQTPTNIQITSTAQQATVNRLGVNLGDQSFWDSGQIMKNLVYRNPGFEGMMYRSILKCAAVTANTCQDDNQYSGQGTGFWNGAPYSVMSGKSLGKSGTVVASVKAGTCSGCGQTITFDQNINAAVGDYFVITRSFTGGGDQGWWDSTGGGGTISTETNDLSPNTAGKQALLLNAGASGQSAGVAEYFDSYSAKSFVQLNGSFQVTFRAKGLGGNNQIYVQVQRSANGIGPYLSKTVTLTTSWQDYTLTFNAAETGSAIGTVGLSFAANGSKVELDDVSMEQTNSSTSNPTVFRDEVVSTLKELNPGSIRMMAAGAALGSNIINQLQVPGARYREGYSTGGTEEDDVAYGIHEFLQLCQTVGADPWVTIPTATTPAEMTAFIQYLTGNGSDQYSALRIARGQSEPWTTVFNKIHIELGNETWNGSFKGESMEYPGYPLWANQVFGAAKSTSGYVPGKFDLVLDGWSSVPWWNQTLLSYSTKHDSIDIAPYLMYSVNNEAQSTMFGAMMAEPEMFNTNNANGINYQTMAAVQSAPTPTNLNVYETNLGTIVGSPTQAQLDALTPSVGAGIATADSMLQMMRLGVKYQNAFSLPQYSFGRSDGLSVKLWGLVVDMGGATNRRRPQFMTEALANSVIGGTMLQTVHTGTNPTWNQPLSSDSVQLNGAHYLQSFAFNNNGKISVILFNLNLTTKLGVTLSGANAPSGSVEMSQITSANLTDNNETSNTVQTSTQTLDSFNPASTLMLPPFSMTVLTTTAAVTPTTQTPTFSIAGGSFTSSQTVSLTDATPNATIYYTTDGGTPTTSSTIYTHPITVTASETIQVMATAVGLSPSGVASATYTISTPTTATPVFSLAAGTYTSAQTVSISDATQGSTIYYTTDGSTPTTASQGYAGAIQVSASETLQAIALAANYNQSAVASAAYTISAQTAATPVFSVAPGTYSTAQTVGISDSTAGATIYYTTNGATPSTYSSVYSGPIQVNATETLQAIAVAAKYNNSAVGSAAYTINKPVTATPVFSLAAGNYTSAQTVSISDATQGSTIYYTTDGSTPTTASPGYAGAFQVTASETVQAIAVAANYSTSAVASAVYTISAMTPAAPPVFSVQSGTYTAPQTVSLSDGTTGATIYYTTDGTTPTTSTNLYSAPINIAQSVTIKALAMATKHAPSGVSVASYSITSAPTAATPTFSVTPGTYLAAQTVALADATPNAVVYYTTDGTPATTASTKYTGPIKISATATIQAIAVAANYTTSGEAVGAYTIVLSTIKLPTATPVLSVQPGSYTSAQTISITDATPGSIIWYRVNGSAKEMRYTQPIVVSQTTLLTVSAATNGYLRSVTVGGKYSISSASSPVTSDLNEMVLRGSVKQVGATVRLTDGGSAETGAAWYKNRVSVNAFTAAFTVQIPTSQADGFTFTLQNSVKGTWAYGDNGDSLGYNGIDKSVAIKFAMWDNDKQAEASETGLLENGASPTTSTTDMSTSGLSLHSGNVLKVLLVYDGTTLVETVTDTVTGATFTQSYKVNIASVLGTSSAYVGFTASTGGYTSVQNLLTFGFAGE